MIQDLNFRPLHITACHADMQGNNGKGRYIFLPGSDSRAKKISQYFDGVSAVRYSSRGHNLYTGTITKGSVTIDVGAISTGMGTPSVDIILNELLKLGGKRFLRLGICGLLQPSFMSPGDYAIATSSIRDENATKCYIPAEFPVLASHAMITASLQASKLVKHNSKVHTGVFHTKSSLYARDFNQGAMAEDNKKYMGYLRKAGAIVSEMESSMIFALCNMADASRTDRSEFSDQRVISGAICGVLGEGEDFGPDEMISNITKYIIEIGIETFFQLNKMGL